ncbi:MAG: hypothetical protein ACREVC_16855 [Burkholderiales bacterium]
MYKSAFANNESADHSHLKWVALHWCAGSAPRIDQTKFRFEVRIAYPDALELALSQPGREEVMGEGLPLPRRHNYFLDHCVVKVADVFGYEQVVECGITDAASLVLPLAARLAHRILWLHYPRNLWNWGEPHKQFDGLLIERKSKASRAVKLANRYPLRVLKSGRHTCLLGNRDADARFLPNGVLQISDG